MGESTESTTVPTQSGSSVEDRATKLSRRQFLMSSPMLVAVAGGITGLAASYIIQPRWQNPNGERVAAAGEAGENTQPAPNVDLSQSTKPAELVELAGVRVSSPEEFASTGKILTVHCYKSEMGQGVETIFAMLVAEELNTTLDFIQTDLIQNPDSLGKTSTVASDSVRSLWQPLRELGATLAAWLIDAAALKWSLSPDQCRVSEGKVTNVVDERQLYWSQIDNLANVPLRKRVKTKRPSEFKLLGRSQSQMALEPIVKGESLFTQDLQFTRETTVMLQRAPSLWHRWVSDNRDLLLASGRHPGLISITTIESDELPHSRSAVLIQGRTTWDAIKAKDALKIEWKRTQKEVMFDDIEAYKRYLDETVSKEAQLNHPNPTLKNVLTATYRLPFLAHQTMETPCCAILLEAGRCEIWIPTQRVKKLRRRAAQLLPTLAADAITIHPQRLGGGFGRKSYSDYMTEAIVVAKQFRKKPGQVIRLLWDRGDDMQHDLYRPYSVQKLTASYNSNGKIKRWFHSSAFADRREMERPSANKNALQMGAKPLIYKVDQHQTERVPVKSDLRIGIWRSVHFTQHTHAVESFVELLARNTQIHPLTYRIQQLDGLSKYSVSKLKTKLLGGVYSANRMKTVLNKLAKLREDVKQVKGVGYAAVYAFHSYVAASIEVVPAEGAYDSNGNRVTGQMLPFELKRVTVVVDAGYIVNPDGALAQVEGSIMFGLSAALYGQVLTKESSVLNQNFDDSRILRANETPFLDIHFIKSDESPAGLGEPVVPVISPALCNAVASISELDQVNPPLRALS